MSLQQEIAQGLYGAFDMGVFSDSVFILAWPGRVPTAGGVTDEEFAGLCNDVPDIAALWAPTGRHVQTVWGMVVPFAQAPPTLPSLLDAIKNASLAYATAKRAGQETDFFWECHAIPADWMTTTTEWTTIHVAGLELDPTSNFVVLGGAAEADHGLWLETSPTGQVATPISQDTTDMTISLDYLRVSIDREWFDLSWVDNAQWWVPGMDVEAVSDGPAVPMEAHAGLMPVAPTDFIAAQNIAITANWAAPDLDRIDTAVTGKAPADFGPFRLTSASTSFDGVTITTHGVQIIGYTCSVLPLCPPTSL